MLASIRLFSCMYPHVFHQAVSLGQGLPTVRTLVAPPDTPLRPPPLHELFPRIVVRSDVVVKFEGVGKGLAADGADSRQVGQVGAVRREMLV